MPEPELQTILDDVRTIKSILQATDAPLPPVWRLLYFVAVPGIVLIALLKYFVPDLAGLSFIDTILWLWIPVLSLVGVIIAVQVTRDVKKTGTRFLAQGRIQVFLYTRFILAPAILTLGYLLSLNPSYSMDGAMAVLFAVGMTQVVVLVPRAFKALPFVFLFGGWAELALNLTGPIWTLTNTLGAGLAFFVIALLLQKGQEHQEADRA